MKSIFTIVLIMVNFISLSGQQNTGDSTTYMSRFMVSTKMTMWTHLTNGDKSLQTGDLATAEKEYKQAYSLIEKALEEGKAHRISIFNETIYDPLDRLGFLYLQTNNVTKAKTYYSLSKKIRENNLPKNSIFKLPPLIGLADVHIRLNELDEAKRYLNQAEKLYNRSPTGWYNFESLGKGVFFLKFEMALREKQYKEAEKYLSRLSSGGYMSIDKNVQANIPKVFDMRARFFIHTNDYEQARYNLDKAEKFAKTLEIQQILFQVEKTKALLEWSENDILGAAQSFSSLIAGYKKYVAENFPGMSEYEREGFFEKLREDFDLYNAFCVQNIDHSIAPSLFQLVYDNQLFSKAILLNHINKQKELILSSGNDELIALLSEWEEEKAQLSSIYFQKKPDPAEIELIEANIYELEKEINSKTDFLKSTNSEAAWQEVRNALNEDEVAIEVIRVKKYSLKSDLENAPDYAFKDEYSYLALLVTPNTSSPEFFVIPNGNDKDGKNLNLYRNSIKHQLLDETSYDIYWKPFQERVGSFETIYLSADGVYNQINLNTLLNPRTGEFVLDETNVIMVTNTKDLLVTPPHSKDRSALLFGRPTYLIQKSNQKQDEIVSELRSFDSRTFDHFREQTFVDLPGTEMEVKIIANVLSKNGWQVSANYGTDATEGQLKESLNPTILHIATHGFFLPQNNSDGVNSMIRSGVILAGVDSKASSSDDDGVLTAYEATNLNLEGTELVVLSACETGLGEIKNGEGVYGLQRGFSVAGTRHLLMSLWKVDDQATQKLMTSFYDNWLGGMKIHPAFRKAQLELRTQYPHPYYWGAFVLLGY